MDKHSPQSIDPISDVESRTLRHLAKPLLDYRTAERIPISLQLSYAIFGQGTPITGEGQSTNLSGRGVQFAISQMVTPQTPCEVSFKLPGQTKTLTLLGQVSWCAQRQRAHRTEFEIGVAFLVANSDQEAAFASFCQFIAAQLLMKYLT